MNYLAARIVRAIRRRERLVMTPKFLYVLYLLRWSALCTLLHCVTLLLPPPSLFYSLLHHSSTPSSITLLLPPPSLFYSLLQLPSPCSPLSYCSTVLIFFSIFTPHHIRKNLSYAEKSSSPQVFFVRLIISDI